MSIFDLSPAEIESRLVGLVAEIRAEAAATRTPIAYADDDTDPDIIIEEWPHSGRRILRHPDGREEDLPPLPR